MKIEITPAEIRRGREGSYCACPIARALEKATGQKWLVWGGGARRANEMQVFQLPKKCTTFVKRFDRGEEVKPFSFELPI